jgi:glutathionylspermidine synthase
MRRVDSPERPGWRTKAAAEGFVFHSPEGRRYWREDARYEFTLKEIEETIEASTAEIEAMVLDIVPDLIGDELYFLRLGFERKHWDWIAESWRRRDPAVYGRYDLAYDGQGPVKLLEAQVDTPTSLYEAAVWQWGWLEEMIAAGALPADADQFNSLHDKIIAGMAGVLDRGLGPRLHLLFMGGHTEDLSNSAYVEDCARQAGLATTLMPISDVGWEPGIGFVDPQAREMAAAWKLYPWEMLLREPYADMLPFARTRWIEPPWKAVLSTKALLPALWAKHPGHPNLLAAFHDDDPRAAGLGGDYVRKPIFGREGANIEIVEGGRRTHSTVGGHGSEIFVRQARTDLFWSPAGHAVLGSWMANGEPAGLGIRESPGPITGDDACFVPHAIVG